MIKKIFKMKIKIKQNQMINNQILNKLKLIKMKIRKILKIILNKKK